jgi:hypothetical protein
MKTAIGESFHQKEQSRIDYNLATWKEWMQADNNKLGYPAKSLIVVGSGSWDTEAEEHSIDIRVAMAMDAIINDLTLAQRGAIWHIWLGSVIRFPRNNLDELYKQARSAIVMGMDKKGIY